MERLLAAAAIVMVLLRPAWAGPYEEAQTAYARGDFATALTHLRPLALSGHPLAQVTLGVMYLRGEGQRKDAAAGEVWLERAAEQDDPKAHFELGLLHLSGIEVARDDAKALHRFRRSASKGYALAQFNLCIMLASGLGADKNLAEAFGWCLQAAEQGYAPAQLQLGRMYRLGQGTTRDYVLAHTWYALAARGFPTVSPDRDRAVRNRDLLALSMSALELADAGRRFAEKVETLGTEGAGTER